MSSVLVLLCCRRRCRLVPSACTSTSLPVGHFIFFKKNAKQKGCRLIWLLPQVIPLTHAAAPRHLTNAHTVHTVRYVLCCGTSSGTDTKVRDICFLHTAMYSVYCLVERHFEWTKQRGFYFFLRTGGARGFYFK
jgi:hypothetical protein